MKKLVIFDLDGTILDTISDITNSMNYVLNYLGGTLIDDETMKAVAKKGRRYIFETAVGHPIENEKYQEYVKLYNDHYFINKNILTKPFDGIVPLLNQLKKEGFLLAVCSNKLHNATSSLIEEVFPDMFDYVIGSSDKILRKPNPDMIIHVLDKLNVQKENAIFVGDTVADIKAAIRAEVYHIAVLFGFGEEKDFLEHQPNRLVSNVNDIYPIITNYFNEEQNLG